MTIFNINEKTPDLHQYCFIRANGKWIFAGYAGKDQDHKWMIFIKETFDPITEWQPAFIKTANPSVDVLNKKVYLDLSDVTNDENVSMFEEFKQSIEVTNDNSNRINSDSEDRGKDIQTEISVL